MRAGAVGPAHWGRRGTRSGQRGWGGGVDGCARVRSTAAGESWLARVGKTRSDPSCRTGDARVPLSPVHCARPARRLHPPAPSSGHSSLDLALRRRPGRFLRGPPGYSPWATCTAREGGISEKGHGGFPGKGARLEATGKGVGANRGPLLHWEILGSPTGRVGNFSPRGSTTRG